jgi:hypothetical protein
MSVIAMFQQLTVRGQEPRLLRGGYVYKFSRIVGVHSVYDRHHSVAEGKARGHLWDRSHPWLGGTNRQFAGDQL